MNRYEKMTDDEFTKCLEDILSETSTGELLSIPGIYEIVSEHFNNEVLEKWENDHPEYFCSECGNPLDGNEIDGLCIDCIDGRARSKKK
jgi:rubrerythrin